MRFKELSGTYDKYDVYQASIRVGVRNKSYGHQAKVKCCSTVKEAIQYFNKLTDKGIDEVYNSDPNGYFTLK